MATIAFARGRRAGDYEPLCGQDGGAAQDLYVHSRDPYTAFIAMTSRPAGIQDDRKTRAQK